MPGDLSPFLLYAACVTALWRLVLVPAVLLAMIGYRTRLLRRRTLKEIMHALLRGAPLIARPSSGSLKGFAHFGVSPVVAAGRFSASGSG